MSFGGQKIAASFGWVALVTYVNRMVGVLSTLILAKVLTPKDFGLVALAAMAIEVLQVLKDMGLGEAVVCSRRDDTKAIDTAHTILVSYHVLLFLVAVMLAPFAASFYENPAVLPVMIALSQNLVWDSLRAVPRALVRRNLDYRKTLAADIVPPLVACVVSIAMALTGWGVWSLVAKTVLHSLLGFVMLRRVAIYKPRFGFDREAARELYQYGRFIAASSLLFIAVFNIDRFYVSHVAGLAALGAFELARSIAEMPVKQFTGLIGNVMMPVFSRMRDTPAELERLVFTTLRYSALVTLPVAVGLAVYGPGTLSWFFGPKWDSMLRPMQLLAIYAAIRALSSIVHDTFKGMGHPQLMQWAVAMKLVVIGVLGLPALQYFGLNGICLLIVVTYTGVFIWEMSQIAKLFGRPSLSLLSAVTPPAALALTLIPASYFVLVVLAGREPPLWALPLGMVAAGVSYTAGIFWLDKETLVRVKAFMPAWAR